MADDIWQEARDRLSVPPSRQALLDLVHWLDQASDKAGGNPLPVLILNRAVLATGKHFLKQESLSDDRGFSLTIAALEQYLTHPTRAAEEEYARCAIASYPFGVGDGCYGIEELGYGCEVGTGCRSGSGTLYLIGLEIGVEAAMGLITAEVLPWLLEQRR